MTIIRILGLVERTFNNSVATIYYFWGNLLYNCIGATIAAVILLVVHRNTLDQVPDRVFIIGELVATPLSLFISLLYQLIEQSSAVVDHDPSLVTNINQNANIGFGPVQDHGLPAQNFHGRIDAGHDSLAGCLFIAGTPV